MLITNSTFSGNLGSTGNNEGFFTVGQGGAVFALEGNIIILSSTFTQNTAYIGGAVYAHTGVIRSAQSIIAGNHAERQGADISFEGRFESGGYNLIGDDGGGRLTVVTSDLVNVDPGLREAGDHLYEFDLDSLSRDAIPSEDCASTEDQRGVARPQGAGCDIGAIEMIQ